MTKLRAGLKVCKMTKQKNISFSDTKGCFRRPDEKGQDKQYPLRPSAGVFFCAETNEKSNGGKTNGRKSIYHRHYR